MQYILTQDELDELKNKPRVTAQEFLTKLGESIIYEKVCIDLLVGPVYVIGQKNFAKALEKTLEYYAKLHS